MAIPKNIMNDVVTENSGSVRSDMMDNESTRPKFLFRKKTDEFGEIGGTENTRKNRKMLWWILGAVAIVVAVFFIVSSFAKANIIVTPKTQSLSLSNQELTLYRSGDGALSPGFQTLEVSDNVTKELTSSGTKHIERKASGTIVVFNEYSPSPLKLIKSTRFQAPNGKIYRTPIAIVVPGTRIEAGKTVPGSIDVNVVADEAGSASNVGLTDFTLPGLQTDPSYSKVYGRSKTVMEGGYTGEVPVVSDDDKAKAEAELEGDLEKKLSDKLSTEIPSGFIIIPNVVTLDIKDLEADYENQNNADGDGSMAAFSKKGSMTGILVSEKDLSKGLMEISNINYDGGDVFLDPSSSIQFEQADPKFDVLQSASLKVKVSGSATVVWKYNIDDIKNAVLGKNKADYMAIFNQFPMIKSAEIKVSPFWKRKFPTNPDKIKVTQEN